MRRKREEEKAVQVDRGEPHFYVSEQPYLSNVRIK